MKKIKTYTFWVALSGSIVILVESVANLFGFSIDSSTIENVIMAICGVLVVLGIVTKDSKSSKQNSTKTSEQKNGGKKEKAGNCENIDLVVNDDAVVGADNTAKTSNDAIDLSDSGVEIADNGVEEANNVVEIVDNGVEEANNIFETSNSTIDTIDTTDEAIESMDDEIKTTDDIAEDVENGFSKQQSINDVVLKILALLESNPDVADIVKGVESISQKDESAESGDSQCSYNAEVELDFNESSNNDDISNAIIDKSGDDLSDEQVSDEVQKVVRHCVDIRRS